MKKDYSGALLLCVLLGGFSSAQEVVWQKDIPSSTQEFLSQITTTIDQQYLITGSSIHSDNSQPSFGSQKQNNGYDLRLMKLNQQGETVWEKYFSGNNHDMAASTVSTQDGGFAVLATSSSSKGFDKKEDSKGGSDFWLIRINEFGDELWQKTIGSTADEEARAVIQTTDLGFFVAGNVQNSPKGYGSKDVLVVRLDKSGKELSQLILGGKGLDEVEKMIPTKDGGALLGIYSRSNLGGLKKTENYGEGDYYIVKLSNTGQIQWEKNFGGKGDDHVRTLALTSTGYLLGGESRSERSGNKSVGIEEGTDLWLVAIDLNGNEQWQKSYNFKNRDVLMGMSVIAGKQEDGGGKSKGILLGGYTQAEGRIENDDETFWMLYLDQNGNEQWRKHVKGESRKKEERLSDIKLNRDGSIVLAGTSAEELGKENWKIMKLGDKQVDQLIEKQDIRIYPNPVTDYVYVELGFEGLKEGAFEAEIAVYDMGGRKLETVKTKNKITKINTQPLIQGAYLVVVKTNDKTANAKLIKK
ncbi:T9SS type A sorting domain-containing protein [Chryseobacterium gambrini]|uniref:T9SS type A sorting domain-containing protein n=1 Tax=Chryseobacterium gambrini TaxID=373672 RepID=A0AAJ1R8J8_9FLAO|nr:MULTISPECIES: T9SS type A sorting domain-containing protein [Chryseobacterium]MDN4014995.1 T9SS type A sorting domain-containing protein [Chryseobacterium gambrini]QWA37279.1 T9SS type A sorting domain-containing protein [Chryseobacterium sp. ZHDP1]